MTIRYLWPEADNLLRQYLNDGQVIVVDTETNGLRPYHGDRIWGVSVYFPHVDTSFYVPVRYENSFNIDWYGDFLELISRHELIVFFNAKFDLHMLYADGMRQPDRIEDVMLAAHLLNENEHLSNGNKKKGAYTLKRLAVKYLGAEAGEGEAELIANAKARGIDPKSGMWQLPAEDVAFYAMKDVEITWQLRAHYLPDLVKWGQLSLYQSRCRFLLTCLMRMEMNGMLVDVDMIHKHIEELTPRIEELQSIFDAACLKAGMKYTDSKDERRINLNSVTQVKAFFGLQGVELEDTEKDTLKELTDIPYISELLEYRILNKAETTYYRPYLQHVTEAGIIHHSLNPTGTETGRLSSYEPNFQQIPKEKGYKVKEVFRVTEGYALVFIDYAALELRLAAHFARERHMGKLLAEGDAHQYTADQLGVSRDLGKRYNFGLLYGMGGKKAARKYGLSLKEAYKGVEGWHDLYPGFRQALVQYENLARVWRNPDGTRPGDFQFVRLFNGRVRHYQEYTKHGLQGEHRGAWNFIVQGTGAAIAEISIQRIADRFPDNNVVRLLNAVHDAVMFEVRLDKVTEVIPEVVKLMIDWPQFNPPMAVDVSISTTSWYDLVKYKETDYAK